METQPPPQTECLCKQFHMVELTVKPARIQDLGCPPSKEAQLLFFFFFDVSFRFYKMGFSSHLSTTRQRNEKFFCMRNSILRYMKTWGWK